MYGLSNLKSQIRVTSDTVQCPIVGCRVQVPRQRGVFRPGKEFLCTEHKIYISPSTFEYESYLSNLLWTDIEDLRLLHEIFGHKRESRMGRDNSEDAVTWNIIRLLEKQSLICHWLSSQDKLTHSQSEVIYWSYCQRHKKAWPELDNARREFGEPLNRSSEPDIIIKTDKALYFIEAKLGSLNITCPTNSTARKRYEIGGDGWFARVFKSSYEDVAIAAKKYELMRYWLLGTWISRQLGLSFRLVCLVVDRNDRHIETEIGSHINQDERNRLVRWSWESIGNWLNGHPSDSADKLIGYMRDKSLGYDRPGLIIKAFDI